MIHDVFAPAKGADRQAATDHFAQCRQIRCHSVDSLSAAETHPKTGHDLIEDQHAAGLIAALSQRFQKAGNRRHAVHIAGDWLYDNAGNLLAHFFKETLYTFTVVVGQHVREIGVGFWHPERIRFAECQCA